MTLARTDRQRGWWDMYDSIPTEYANYICLEEAASSIKRYDLLLIHGLLQNESYARAVIHSGLMSLAPAQEVDRRVEIRLTRQEILRRPKPLDLWVVFDEAALRRIIGGPEVMRDQCMHLLAQAERPNMTIQVLPNALGAHPGAVGAFSIMEFLHRYSLVFDQLRAMALGPGESLDLISRIAEGL